MKKLLILLICFSFVLSGCSSDKVKTDNKKQTSVSETENTKSDAAKPVEVPELTPNEFYTMATNSQRPVAVMIDNDSEAARPQIGLESAYLVYEIIVEGGATRFMALFKNYDLEKIGPVRSSRHYFLDYVMENDAIYAHAGWSPLAQSDIPKLGINNINGILGVDERNFWRDNTYDKTYHNLYTSIKKLSEHAKNSKGYSLKGEDGPIEFLKVDSTPEGTDCTELGFKYSNGYRVGYVYKPEEQTYERYINGKPHMSQTGDVVSAKNIIIYNVANYDLRDGENKGRQNLNNIGSGEGWYVTNGKSEKITWSKEARNAKTVYKNSKGEVLSVNPGLTFIQIIPMGNSINIK
ncbi:MAG: DUF3048 domain-containing protein [Clostridia bacterium]|nr:DUF3048 domain-containing protein [Clostridia bacterium]